MSDSDDSDQDLFADEDSDDEQIVQKPKNETSKKEEHSDGLESSDEDDAHEDSKKRKMPKKLGKRKHQSPVNKKKKVTADSAPKRRVVKGETRNEKPKRAAQSASEDEIEEDSDESDGENLQKTKEDEDFIDSDDDNKSVLGEYNAEKQDFKEEKNMFKYSDDEDEKTGSSKKKKSNAFTETVESLKAKKHRRKFEKEDLEKMSSELLDSMHDAWKNDKLLIENKKPTYHKLKMLDTLVSMLKKKFLYDDLLDNQLLSEIKNWLTPLDDGSLPSLNIRRELYSIINDLPVTIQNLRTSKLGETLMILCKHPKETEANRNILKGIIEKWSRLVFAKDNNFRSLSQHLPSKELYNRPSSKQTQRKASSSNRSPPAESSGLDIGRRGERSNKTNGDAAVDDGGHRVRIPYSVGFSYSTMPVREKRDQGEKKEETQSDQVKKKLTNFTKSFGKTKRSETVRVDARNAGT